uniref:Uncharacterized protein n=1 Tax=viral metagenome TaxID=1070528 RepID=A0A6C0BND2_9ZZZZ
MSSIPECRKYPWLFKSLRCDRSTVEDECECKVCMEGRRQREIIGSGNPFRDPNVTCQDVLVLIGLGYRITHEDTRDIEEYMHMDEIFKLSEHMNLSVYPESLLVNHSYSMKYHGMIQRERSRHLSKIVITDWNLRDITRCVDVSQILKHSEIEWDRSLLSMNQSVCLEHIPLITSTEGEWDVTMMLERSCPDLSLSVVVNNPTHENIIEVSKNPSLKIDHIRALVTLDGWNEECTDNVLRFCHPEVIIDCVNSGVIKYSGSWKIWINRLIYQYCDQFHVFGSSRCRCYVSPTLGIGECMWDFLDDEEKLIMSYHPRILEILSIDEVMQYNSDIYLTSDIDLLIELLPIDDEEVSLLDRPDITSEQVEKILKIAEPWSILSAWSVHPEQLISQLEDADRSLLGTSRYLDLDRLGEYMNDESEYPSGRVSSRDEILNELTDYSEIWTNHRLNYETIMALLRDGRITYDDLRDGVDDYTENANPDDIMKLHEAFPNLLQQSDVSYALRSIRSGSLESILRFNDPITHPLCHHDACELIEPYYFKREDILSHNELSPYMEGGQLPLVMDDLPDRFKVLLSLGHLRCVRNCFKPIPFSSSSLKAYPDIEVICT